MLDHILGRPSASYKRSQVFLVVAFWSYILFRSPKAGPRALYLRRLNRYLQRFTPWQVVCATLTFVYALRHVSDLVGLGSPEPLSRLYSRSYYRATWIATAFDVGLATAMPIRPKWVRDLAGFLFACYYVIYANEADEKLRKFRSTATVEMLRTTWEKPLNPYVRLITWHFRPSLPFVRTLFIPRPSPGPRSSLPPIKVVLFFDGTASELSRVDEVVLDFPGGGFICMGPDCHEERLRYWGRRFGRSRKEGTKKRIVVSADYGKSPEYPYPWAIDECFDLYLALVKTNGAVLGLQTTEPIDLILTGDSAGANIVCTVLFNLLENPLGRGVQQPKAIILAYAALDFNFTSWMSQENLRILREETSVKRRTTSGADLSSLEEAKDHLAHRSPLAVVHDLPQRRTPQPSLKRTKSWSQMFGFGGLSPAQSPRAEKGVGRTATGTSLQPAHVGPDLHVETGVAGSSTGPARHRRALSAAQPFAGPIYGDRPRGVSLPAGEGEDDVAEDVDGRAEEWKSLRERVRTPKGLQSAYSSSSIAHQRARENNPFEEGAGQSTSGSEDDEGKVEREGTRLTMTSRSGYFQDRIITPSMMRAMAILYIGPTQNPDFHSDYYISPILAPSALLAQFPPALLICGEKDPFVDDTVIIAGRIREAREQAGLEKESEGSEWVRMAIMEGWGHGYLQMVALMPEIKSVLEDMAGYMDDAFADNLFPQSTTSTSLSHSPSISSSTSLEPSRSWFSRLFRSQPNSLVGNKAFIAPPVTPPPSVITSPPEPSSPRPSNAEQSLSTVASAFVTSVDEDSEVLAFTPKRLRSPPLVAPRHGILKKPPPTSIPLPPPLFPQESNRTTTDPSPSTSNPSTHHQQPNSKTLPSLLAAALTRSLTPPSSVLHSTSLGTPAQHPGSGFGTPMLGPGGKGKRKEGAALDEKELMRRRRADAVFGMEMGGTGVIAEDAAGGAGSKKKTDGVERVDEGEALEEEMEEFLL